MKMDARILILSALYIVTEVTSNDVRLGLVAPSSRKIYGEIKEADPALWKRTDDVIINTPHNEIISAVFVTDLRDDKDGEAFIESGGVGEKSVTIGLKSPSILRGYKFEIEVYGNDPSAQFYSKGGFAPYSGGAMYPRKY
ncbi:uncharacterized protein LOC110993402 [Pieris rapae]|uniref:uncharacterized protein LOC110993402 n=1 Tax=Pieris rapae TaxID=64459 RepID=UPI001E27CADC|nr:uncharacterized protein LOC110993402 [Pieris rapae]